MTRLTLKVATYISVLADKRETSYSGNVTKNLKKNCQLQFQNSMLLLICYVS